MPEHEEGGSQASDAEVRSAIMGLTPVDRKRLTRWGQTLLFIYGDYAEGREPMDLYQQAIERTLGGNRKWKIGRCTFMKHIWETMRSIASHLPDKYGGSSNNVPIRSSNLHNADANMDDPIENISSEAPTASDSLDAKKALDRVVSLFEDDEEAFNVLVCLAEEKTESEIQRELDLSRNKVHAIIERIRYRLAKAAK